MWTAAFFARPGGRFGGDTGDRRRILLVLAVSGGIVGVLAGVTSAGQEQELVGMGTEATGRAEGSFGHPNLLAVFLATALAAAGAVAIGGKPRPRTGRRAAFARRSPALCSRFRAEACWRPRRRSP